MLRIVIKTEDCVHVVHGAASQSQTTVKTFDVDLPEVEAFLITKPSSYWYSNVVGIEVLPARKDGR
jgi:hypothetical protein